MPDLNDLHSVTGEVTNIARDAAYVAIGLGVLGFQKAQVQRVELKSKLAGDLAVEQRLAEVREAVANGIRQVDGIVEGALQLVETSFEPLEEQLPPVARELSHRARQQAREVRTQIRELVVPGA
ncbi:MAG: hypothetical protein M0Z95_29320 [Actinomycetota bacterium]|jgi:hypothetical protein|nr:hypothetical protein [Actinomycetota bacterium]